MTHTAKSPLRYPGGKSRALAQITAQLPPHFGELREPFVGGGSVFLAAPRHTPAGQPIARWINDLNYDLVCFWRAAQADDAALATAVTALKQQHSDGAQLYALLKNPDVIRTDFERAVRFFVMNRITFSGTIDSGGYSAHAFAERFTDSSIARLIGLGAHLRDVRITHGDYAALVLAPAHDPAAAPPLIFLDPPYLSVTHSKLYGKSGALHTGFDHARFADVMRQCPHRWLITYDDSPTVRALFSFANIIEWQLQYGMNNYKRTTAPKGKELFIRNY
jgi:DNA adenine methylase